MVCACLLGAPADYVSTLPHLRHPVRPETERRTAIRQTVPTKAPVEDKTSTLINQESPAMADKPARRESVPKIAPIRRAYNVVADNTGLSSCV